MSSSKIVVLMSSDNETFEVDEAVAIESQTIKRMIEDGCVDTKIHLPNIPSNILSKVIEYCKKHVESNTEDNDLLEFDTEFVKVDQDTLFKLTMFYLAWFEMANRAQISTNNSALIAMIADEDTITVFLLAGVGNVDLRRKTNYLIVDSKTTVKQIEDSFKEFTTRDDVAIVLISQFVANMIRFLVDSYNKPVPAILEIPSKDHPYDP